MYTSGLNSTNVATRIQMIIHVYWNAYIVHVRTYMYSRKLPRVKNFANQRKYRISRRKLSWIANQDCGQVQYFGDKNLRGRQQYRKVFTCESFQLSLYSMWNLCVITLALALTNLSLRFKVKGREISTVLTLHLLNLFLFGGFCLF